MQIALNNSEQLLKLKHIVSTSLFLFTRATSRSNSNTLFQENMDQLIINPSVRLIPHRQVDPGFLRVQKRRFSSKGGARTFWESGFSKPVKKSIKDVKRVTLASSDLPRRETTRGTIAYRKNRKLGKPSTHD